MKKTTNFLITGMLGMAVLLGACSKDKTPDAPVDPGKPGRSKYVFVYTGKGDGAATYIVSTDDITKGGVSSTNNGVEVDAWSFIVQNNTVFAQAYNEQGLVRPFRLNEQGKIFEAGRAVTTFRTGVSGKVGNDFWVGGGDPRSSGVGELYRFDAINLQLSGRSTTDLKKITGTGFNAVWTGLFEVDNKIYLPYYKFKHTPGGRVYEGEYGSLDSTWVAVFSYPELKYEKTISDDRTGFIGDWSSQQGLKQIENGDTYAWSTASGDGEQRTSTKPSGIVRIKKGAEQFDKSYFFNVEAAVGSKICRGEYIGKGKFLMAVYTDAKATGGKIKMIIADVFNNTVTPVPGVPVHEFGGFKLIVYAEPDGKTINYVMEDSAGEYYVYIINADNGTVTRGVHIEGAAGVTAISKLTY
ncbi:hypothetical protein HDE69_004224 [Pedobacter cryoconitis]|uniref:DUF4374 domain-containing protein n=1 Tax=Pedobacter cryoconitis TaxID=188932 RepID=A0A7W8YWP2_9SPHI|nr:DUF4374 domain-containing protein [Pedobacter cryoconitis]MBB5623141.1 hypothetical protein [Pedobacter cryoconitis]MBB5648520.1 hypothetical protein [Pedobacter cryoconitis]